MMKKFLMKNNFTITLIALVIICTTILINKDVEVDLSNYVTIHIVEGDTLWQIASNYAEQSNMTNEQFISWVESSNNISRELIRAGETIFIPVNNKDSITANLLVSNYEN